MAAAAVAKLPGAGCHSGRGARGVSGSRRPVGLGVVGAVRLEQRVAVGQVLGDGGGAVGPARRGLGGEGGRACVVGDAGQADAERAGEEGGAAGGVGAGFGPEPVGEGDGRGAVGGGVEGLEVVDGAADRGAVEAVAEGSEAAGDLRVGVGLAPERAREDRGARLVAGEADPRLGRRRGGAPGVADDLVEGEGAGRLVVGDDLDGVGGRLVAEEEAVGDAGVAGAGGGIAGDRDDDARRGEIVGRGGEALQRAAEGDERGRDVLGADGGPQAVEQGLERVGEAAREDGGEERVGGGRRFGRGDERRRRARRGGEAGGQRGRGRGQLPSAVRSCSPGQQSSATSSPRAKPSSPAFATSSL